MTYVVSKWRFSHCRGCKQFLESTTAFATSDVACARNNLFATGYLKSLTSDANFQLK